MAKGKLVFNLSLGQGLVFIQLLLLSVALLGDYNIKYHHYHRVQKRFWGPGSVSFLSQPLSPLLVCSFMGT